jgi:hypothetical protein
MEGTKVLKAKLAELVQSTATSSNQQQIQTTLTIIDRLPDNVLEHMLYFLRSSPSNNNNSNSNNIDISNLSQSQKQVLLQTIQNLYPETATNSETKNTDETSTHGVRVADVLQDLGYGATSSTQLFAAFLSKLPTLTEFDGVFFFSLPLSFRPPFIFVSPSFLSLLLLVSRMISMIIRTHTVGVSVSSVEEVRSNIANLQSLIAKHDESNKSEGKDDSRKTKDDKKDDDKKDDDGKLRTWDIDVFVKVIRDLVSFLLLLIPVFVLLLVVMNTFASEAGNHTEIQPRVGEPSSCPAAAYKRITLSDYLLVACLCLPSFCLLLSHFSLLSLSFNSIHVSTGTPFMKNSITATF